MMINSIIKNTTQPLPLTVNYYFLWQIIGLFLIIFMVALGGYTRVSGSGLSITTWDPISGIMFPITDFDWQVLFEKYKLSPEYKHANYGITLNDFKSIFWPEFLHRILGRVIFLWFIIPYKYYKNNVHYKIIICMIAFQGFVGWYMTYSGLFDSPTICHFRLALHLFFALLIFVYCFACFLSKNNNLKIAFYNKFIFFAITIFLVTFIFGAFVAGLRAGLIYNSFPLFNSNILPDEISLKFVDYFTNPACVQFAHRAFGILSLIVFVLMILKYKKNIGMKMFYLSFCIITIQIISGVLNVLLQCPIGLCILHQINAFILFCIILQINHILILAGIK